MCVIIFHESTWDLAKLVSNVTCQAWSDTTTIPN
ncbi:rCG57916, partial [Rattus norvegicus]